MQRRTVLNIGCGDKLYKTTELHVAINADIVTPKNKEADLKVLDVVGPESLKVLEPKGIYFHQTDVRNLPYIESNSFDEILAFHLLEHINVWEVPGMLQEWKRVLKPGGRVVLEQPDLIKCCINFLNVTTTGDPKIWYRKGMLGFFGKQDINEPYMQHKWGYWPDSTIKLLESQGFVEIEHQESTTGSGETRDFRVVGLKAKESV